MDSLKKAESSLPQIEPKIDEIKAELARRHLKDFIIAAWPVLEPITTFQENWHIDVICEHLEAVTSGEIRNLIINIPPGSLKSLGCCVFWPCWEWIDAPGERTSFSSYSEKFALRDSGKCLELINSSWYQQHFGNRFRLERKGAEKITNNKKGSRLASGVLGLTGERARKLVIDDPHNLSEIYSDTMRASVNRWIREVWWARIDDPALGARVAIGQRGHDDDAFHTLMELGDFQVLSIPERYEKHTSVPNGIKFNDPRKEDGDLLWPERRNEEYVSQWERVLGSYGASAQLQQRPSPLEGGIVKRSWWRRYKVQPAEFDEITIFGDLTFKGEETAKKPAYVSLQVWGIKGVIKTFLDMVHEKMDFTDTQLAFRALCRKWPQARAKVFEDAANAAALQSTEKNKISGIMLFPRDDDPDYVKSLMRQQDKIARLLYTTPEIQAGNIQIPEDGSVHFDVAAFVEQAANFKASQYKDMVDTFAMMVLYYSIRNRAERHEEQYRSAGKRKMINIKQNRGTY